MLKALVKTRLAALWASFYTRTRSAKNGKKPSKIGGIGIAILLIYAAIVFAGMFSAMFFGIAELYHAQGIGWLYFALAGILAAGFCLMGSVFTAQTQLSAAGYTPYEGFKARGSIAQVYLRGTLAVDHGEMKTGPIGTYIPRHPGSL